MKYSKILLGACTFLGLGILSSCDVNDEFYDELDKKEVSVLVEDVEYTLVEADYKFFESDDDELKNKIAKYKNFSKDYTAATYMAEFVNDMYPYFDKGSTAVISYNFYQGGLGYIYDLVDYKDELEALEEEYELTSDDYDSMGENSGEPGKYNNFDSNMDIPSYIKPLLAAKYPDAVADFMVSLTYKFYSGSTADVVVVWKYNGTEWNVATPTAPEGVEVYELTEDDYDSMGAPGSHDNFSSSEPASKYLPTFLLVKNVYAQVGDKTAVIYRDYKGKIDGVHVTEWEAVEYSFDGTMWNEYSRVVELKANFKRTSTEWAFVPPTKFIKSEKTATETYTLTDADYDFVGNGKYGNFDTRDDKPEADEAVIIDKISRILKNNFDIAVGDVYEVTYTFYDGTGNGEGTLTLEAVEDN